MGHGRFGLHLSLRFVACAALSIAPSACSSESGGGGGPSGTNEPAPVLPLPSNAPLACDPGTMASIERGQCVPVGPAAAALASAFEPAAGGWGFVAKRPAKACGDDERVVLGKTSCVPIDDGCDRAFPPADATIVVVPGAETSGKVVGSIELAIAQAKAGDVIALDSGEHGTFEVDVPVRIVGRCASKVVMRPMNGRTSGVWFGGTGKSSLESVTVTGARTGVRVISPKADVELRRVRLAKNDNGIDTSDGHLVAREIVVDGPWTERKPTSTGAAAQGGTIELEDSVLQNLGTHVAATQTGGRVVLRRTLVRGPEIETASLTSVLVAATAGGVVEIEESALVTTQALASVDSGMPDKKGNTAAGTLKVSKSELTQRGKSEIAVTVAEGGRVSMEDVSLFHVSAFGLGAVGGEVTLTRTVVVADKRETDMRTLLDLSAQSRGVVTESALLGGYGSAVAVRGGGSSLTMDHALAMGARYAQASGEERAKGGIEIGDRAALTVRGSTIASVQGTAVLVAKDGFATLETTLVDAPSVYPGAEASTGVGVTVHESSAVLDRVIVRRAAGPGVAYASGRAMIKSSRLSENRVGLLVIDKSAMLDVKDEPADLVDDKILLYRTSMEGNVDAILQADGYL